MKEEKILALTQMRQQMLKLRNDSSLLKGFSFNTVAGDIRFDNKETALVLIDFLISDIQKQITYLMKK